MEKIRRTIHPQTKVRDADKGIVAYVASNETVDSYQEVIMATAWRFTNFEKNSPFVDSHDYSTISKCVGRVIDFRVSSGQLIEVVQWAINCGNPLADLGWNMTKEGYLKAVSVGFFPVKFVTPNSGQDWTEALEELGMNADAQVRTIYTQAEQVELSACIVGANPDALAQAKSAGIINDSHLEQFPGIRQKLESFSGKRRTFSFPTTTKQSSREKFMNQLHIFSRRSSLPTAKAAYDRVESLRGDGTEEEMAHAVAVARRADALDRGTFKDAIQRFLSQDGHREYINGLFRYLAKQPVSAEHKEYFDSCKVTMRDLGLSPVSASSGFLLYEGMSQQLFDLIYIYGQFKTLGLRTMVKNYTKFSKTTGRPSAVFISPSMSLGTPIAPDANFAGVQLLPPANMVASLVNVAKGLTEDAAVDFSQAMTENFTQAIANRVDFAAFVGTGAMDSNSEGATGLFNDKSIVTVNTNLGSTNVGQLGRGDCINAIAAIAPAALQRPCFWWISPVFLPALMKCAEANGAYWLLKSPAETGDGTWNLAGFPVVWTSVAPSVDGPGQTFAAFGEPNSYLVDMQEEIYVEVSDKYPAAFSLFQDSFRAWTRNWCQTREATGLAKLQLSAR